MKCVLSSRDRKNSSVSTTVPSSSKTRVTTPAVIRKASKVCKKQQITEFKREPITVIFFPLCHLICRLAFSWTSPLTILNDSRWVAFLQYCTSVQVSARAGAFAVPCWWVLADCSQQFLSGCSWRHLTHGKVALQAWEEGTGSVLLLLPQMLPWIPKI